VQNKSFVSESQVDRGARQALDKTHQEQHKQSGVDSIKRAAIPMGER